MNFNLKSRLTQLDDLARRQAEQQQQVERLQTDMAQVEGLIAVWDKQITWKQGPREDLAVLLKLRAKLENLLSHWETSLSVDKPEQQVNRLQAELKQSQADLAQLRQVEHYLEEMVRWWQSIQGVQTRRHLLEQINQTQQAIVELQNVEPELIEAFNRHNQLQAQVETQEKLQRCLAETARQLAHQLPNGHSDEWAAQVLTDIDGLSQEIGVGLAKLEQGLKSHQQAVKQFKSQIDTKEAQLQPIREQVTRLEADVQQTKANLQNKHEELIYWGKTLDELDRPSVKGEDMAALTQFLVELQAEYYHLAWFKELVDGYGKEKS